MVSELFGRENLYSFRFEYMKSNFRIINNNDEWTNYLFANKELRNKIDSYVAKAIKAGKSSFDYVNKKVILAGNGGYFTGYQLLNGSNKKVGGFCASGTITKLRNGKYSVTVSFGFNDIVDINESYRSDILYGFIMRNVVLNKGNGVDYIIRISGTITYTY